MKLAQVPPGFELQLFAAEPDIVKPITMAWDERGRLWICESVDYPNEIHPGTPGRDRIKILEDTNGDGRADKFTVFAEGLNIPTGITFYNGGVIVAQVPDMLYLKDTNGDDKADVAPGAAYRLGNPRHALRSEQSALGLRQHDLGLGGLQRLPGQIRRRDAQLSAGHLAHEVRMARVSS